MKILYLSQRFSFKTAGIYADLINTLASDGHRVTVVSCSSNGDIDYKNIKEENGCRMIYARVGNQFGSNYIKKALVQFAIPGSMLKSIKKNLQTEKFDLILYPTPPITFAPVIKWCKRHFNARSYLMLKDIFPQNAVDLGMIKDGSLIHKLYQKIEKNLYDVSDVIGCMSEANRLFIKKNQPAEIYAKTEIFPNAVDCEKLKSTSGKTFRKKGEQTIFLFGGNMGKPQAVEFLLKCIDELKDYDKAKFLLMGSGSESGKITAYIEKNKSKNIEYNPGLPRDEYEKIVANSDIGLVMLNHDFTIPNFPARTLSYMAKGIPILAATDTVTDVRELVTEKANCGLWCESNDTKHFCDAVKAFCEMSADELEKLGDNGFNYLKENFDVKISAKILDEYIKI